MAVAQRVRICREYDEIERVCLIQAKTTEELMEQLSFVENARSIGSLRLRDRIKVAVRQLLLLMDIHVFPRDHTQAVTQAVTWPQRILPIFEKHDEASSTILLFILGYTSQRN